VALALREGDARAQIDHNTRWPAACGRAGVTVRPCLSTFAVQMERKLRRNDHRPGWRGDDPLDLLWALREHADKLESCLRAGASSQQTIADAADIGNFAMMIADICLTRIDGATER